MKPRARPLYRPSAWPLMLCGLFTLWGSGAQGQAPAPTSATAPRIYSCVTPDGRRVTSDRPINDCLSREQRVLRKDGSMHGVLPPAMSPEERAAAEARAREEAVQKSAVQDAARHDRNLLARYRAQDRHDAARQAALDDIVKATEGSARRLKDLAKERKGLDDEAEFYKGKLLPPKLKQAIDTNDAAMDAQQLFISQQTDERARVNRRFDLELARLKKLWAGAPPGSLGPPPSARDPAPATAAQADAASAPVKPAVKPSASSAAR